MSTASLRAGQVSGQARAWVWTQSWARLAADVADLDVDAERGHVHSAWSDGDGMGGRPEAGGLGWRPRRGRGPGGRLSGCGGPGVVVAERGCMGLGAGPPVAVGGCASALGQVMAYWGRKRIVGAGQ